MRRTVPLSALIAAATIVIASRPASPHSWYPIECCSGQDCRPVPCDTLVANDRGGVTYTPANTSFRQDRVRPSQDASCHICTSGMDGGGIPYCAFTLQGF